MFENTLKKLGLERASDRAKEQLATMFEVNDVIDAVATNEGVEQAMRKRLELTENIQMGGGHAAPGEGTQLAELDKTIDVYLADKLQIQLSNENRVDIYKAVIAALDSDVSPQQIAAE